MNYTNSLATYISVTPAIIIQKEVVMRLLDMKKKKYHFQKEVLIDH